MRVLDGVVVTNSTTGRPSRGAAAARQDVVFVVVQV
jgi:hypothetical protein